MVDPLTAAGALAKAGSIVSSEEPEVQEFAAQVAGTGRGEVGAWIADHVRLRRLKAQLKIFSKAQKMAAEAGFQPQEVKLNILVPLLESGSLEEDDSMCDRWAALLANAADDRVAESEISPAFTSILGQISPTDAAVLDAVYGVAHRHPQDAWISTGAASIQVQEALSLSASAFAISRQNLIRLGLCGDPANSLEFTDKPELRYQLRNTDITCLTELGSAFVDACRAPSPVTTPSASDG